MKKEKGERLFSAAESGKVPFGSSFFLPSFSVSGAFNFSVSDSTFFHLHLNYFCVKFGTIVFVGIFGSVVCL